MVKPPAPTTCSIIPIIHQQDLMAQLAICSQQEHWMAWRLTICVGRRQRVWTSVSTLACLTIRSRLTSTTITRWPRICWWVMSQFRRYLVMARWHIWMSVRWTTTDGSWTYLPRDLSRLVSSRWIWASMWLRTLTCWRKWMRASWRVWILGIPFTVRVRLGHLGVLPIVVTGPCVFSWTTR